MNCITIIFSRSIYFLLVQAQLETGMLSPTRISHLCRRIRGPCWFNPLNVCTLPSNLYSGDWIAFSHQSYLSARYFLPSVYLSAGDWDPFSRQLIYFLMTEILSPVSLPSYFRLRLFLQLVRSICSRQRCFLQSSSWFNLSAIDRNAFSNLSATVHDIFSVLLVHCLLGATSC